MDDQAPTTEFVAVDDTDVGEMVERMGLHDIGVECEGALMFTARKCEAGFWNVGSRSES